MDKIGQIVYSRYENKTETGAYEMGTVRKLKSAIQENEKFSKMLVRSGRHTVLLDLDGDQVPDIGLFDLNHDGDCDAVAVDLTGNGEFNFYLVDHDGNGIPDEISFYQDGEETPVKSTFGPEVEEEMRQKVSYIHELMTNEDLAADLILDAIDALQVYIAEEYAALEEQGISIDEE